MDTLISCDSRGMIEYTDCRTLAPLVPEALSFQYKSDTDLYAIAKAKVVPLSLAVSPQGDKFVVFTSDCTVWVFDVLSGKLKRKYDESLKANANVSLINVVIVLLKVVSPYFMCDRAFQVIPKIVQNAKHWSVKLRVQWIL